MIWKDPPAPKSGGPGCTVAFVAELRMCPGQWGLYPKTMAAVSSASTYRKSNPGTEWTCRRRADGRYDMYGRWVGES